MDTMMYELKGAAYAYHGDIPALGGIDLSVKAGEKAGLIGANGSGKSTLLMLLDGLVFPSGGTVRFSGAALAEKSFDDPAFSRAFRRRVGYVFQNPEVQLFCPSVRDELAFGPLHLGMPEERVRERLNAAAEALRIGHLLDRAPFRLSLGEKKKVALASVLIGGPEVLLLDEPTAGLDPQTVRDIIDIILGFNAAGGTVITATHDLHVVEEIADVIHVMGNGGRIIRSGSPDEVLADRDFLRANNLVHIHKHHHAHGAHVHPHGAE